MFLMCGIWLNNTLLCLKALLHGAIFHATCLATALRDKLHGPLHRVTCCAMVKIVVRQVAPIVAQSRIGFYFLQRLQQLFSTLHGVTHFQELVSQCFHKNYRKKCTNALQRLTPLTLQLQRRTNHHCETSCMQNCTV